MHSNIRFMKTLIFTIIMLLNQNQAAADAGVAQEFKHMPLRQHQPGIIKVMVIDTGIDQSHDIINEYLDKKDQEKNPADYKDLFDHGTHITGIVLHGRSFKSGEKFVHEKSVCTQVKVYSCNYFSNPKMDTVSCFKRAYEEKMDIVNYSSTGKTYIQEEYDIIAKLQKIGTIVVASAGNEHTDLRKTPFYPASYAFHGNGNLKVLENVIPVGAVDEYFNLVSFSNYGYPMVMESGERILSTIPNKRFGRLRGTSQAAAIYTHKLLINKCNEINN
jgi:major intracellular serine protease